MTEIIIPDRYPGDDEYVALATRMRIAGAWDPQNDWLVRTNDPAFNRSRYGQFINDCVGYEQLHRNEISRWKVCASLQWRGFTSLMDYGSYVVRKL